MKGLNKVILNREALDRAAFDRYGAHHHYIKATTKI